MAEIPMTENPDTLFLSVIGQTRAKAVIARALASGRLAGAYLFTGPKGVGRFAMALELARITNCENDPLDSAAVHCACASCKNIRKWLHPNLIPIFPLPPIDPDKGAAAEKVSREYRAARAGHPYVSLNLTGSGRILIDQIKDIRHRLSFTTDGREIRTVIIEPAERMHDEPANALLKILEEPPAGCCIILIADSEHSLLPTIVSRCQIIPFAPLTKEEIYRALVEREGTPDVRARIAAQVADGSYARALSALTEEPKERLDLALEFLRTAASGNAGKIMDVVAKFNALDDRSKISQQLEYVSWWVKDALVLSSLPQEQAQVRVVLSDGQDITRRIAELYGGTRLRRALFEIEEARLAVHDNAIIPLALTAAVIKLHRIFTQA